MYVDGRSKRSSSSLHANPYLFLIRWEEGQLLLPLTCRLTFVLSDQMIAVFACTHSLTLSPCICMHICNLITSWEVSYFTLAPTPYMCILYLFSQTKCLLSLHVIYYSFTPSPYICMHICNLIASWEISYFTFQGSNQ